MMDKTDVVLHVVGYTLIAMFFAMVGILIVFVIFNAEELIRTFPMISVAYADDGIIIESKPKQELKLDCLLFTDGTLAVVKYSNRGGCGPDSGAMNTISYLLKKGYHIDAVVPTAESGDFMMDMGAVFMSR